MTNLRYFLAALLALSIPALGASSYPTLGEKITHNRCRQLATLGRKAGSVCKDVISRVQSCSAEKKEIQKRLQLAKGAQLTKKELQNSQELQDKKDECQSASSAVNRCFKEFKRECMAVFHSGGRAHLQK